MGMRDVVIGLAVVSLVACGGGGSKPSDGMNSPQPSTGTTGSSNQSGGSSTAPDDINAEAFPMPMMPMPGVSVPGTPTSPVTSPISPTNPVTSPISPINPVNPTPPTVQATFQYLPVLQDEDGNPNDASASYSLTAENNIPVRVDTPAGSFTTPMMRYNGLQLPPVIKTKRGTNVTVNLRNNLSEITTIHWHGFKIPADQDGGPESPIAAGGSFTYRFQIAQAAGPLWFHPHAEGTTATQVYRGLAGAFIVTDEITDALEAGKQLPSGAQDVALLVQDRSFGPADAAGVRPLVYGGMMAGMMGMLGNQLLINGVEQPTLNVDTRLYRFRLFNGSNARTYDFALSNGATFQVIGTDGGLLPAPVTTDHIVLAAGERAEIVIDFRGAGVNDSIALINRPTNNLVAIRFNVTNAVTDDVSLYSALPGNADIYQRLTANDANLTRTFNMSMVGMMTFGINGKLFDINRVDEQVSAGATEIWAISNATGMAHPFHAHAIQWQILDRNGVPASGIDLGWKDTVLVQPGETVRFIGRFDPVINIGMYMYHCHILEHEERGMMGTFRIQ